MANLIRKILRKIINKDRYLVLKRTYLFFIRYVRLLTYYGSKHKCPFCNHSFKKFISGGIDTKVSKENKVVGAGYRTNAMCPYCESSDRERLLVLFIREHKLIKEGMKLLHFAPELSIQKLLKKEKIDYYSADLDDPLAKYKMNIMDIKFDSDFFDGIICNHVFEHIIEDHKAISEIYRVLKPGGWAILQVPFSPLLNKSIEDPNIISESEREKTFGQSDHIRLYGLDYLKRLESVGFKVEQKNLSPDIVEKYALNPNEPIFFCIKK